jgi:hypothetical protein
MSQKVRKFINPRFVNTLDLSLMRRLLERSKEELKGFDLTVLDGDEEEAREELLKFFAGPIDGYPAALRGDLHRIADLGTAKGLEIILEQARRAGIDLFPELKKPDAEEPTKAHEPKHIAVRVYLEHPDLFDVASDYNAMLSADRPEPMYGKKRGVPADLTPEKVDAFKTAITKLFTNDFLGDFNRVGVYDDEDEIVLVMSHSAAVTTLEIARGAKREVISVRLIGEAVIRYSENNGMLRLARVRKALHAEVAEIFAREVLGAPGFFEDAALRDVYTLEPVEKAGLAFAFDHSHDPLIEKVDIVEVAADLMVPGKSGGMRIERTLRSRRVAGGALAGFKGTPVDFSGSWRIGELVFRVTFKSEKPRKPQLTVRLRPPRVLQFQRSQHEARIETLIARNKLLVEHEDIVIVDAAE